VKLSGYACIRRSRFIGGLYGRAVGHMLVYAHGGPPVHEHWLWIDPGAFALMGAASFFAGVTRLTFSLTIIIVRRLCLIHARRELDNKIQLVT